MKKKKIILSAALVAVCAMTCSVNMSCSGEEIESTSEISKSPVSLATMQPLYNDCLNHPVIVSDVKSTRAVLASSVNLTPLYLERPQPLASGVKIKKEELVTFNDIIALQDELGVSFSTTPSINTIDCIYIDAEKAEKCLCSMVKESKQWLYSKGMSETDIQSMLTEEGATESELVPFVLGCMDAENRVVSAVNVDWDKAEHCALAALGLDFTTFLGTSGIKTWGKVALKKAFKCVAQKALGPAGAAIAAIEFGVCMY